MKNSPKLSANLLPRLGMAALGLSLNALAACAGQQKASNEALKNAITEVENEDEDPTSAVLRAADSASQKNASKPGLVTKLTSQPVAARDVFPKSGEANHELSPAARKILQEAEARTKKRKGSSVNLEEHITPKKIPSSSLNTSPYSCEKEDIELVFSNYEGAINYCYQHVLKANPDLSGQATIDFKVVPDGKGHGKAHILTIYSEPQIQDVMKCVRTKMENWSFPESCIQHQRIKYPLTFRPKF